MMRLFNKVMLTSAVVYAPIWVVILVISPDGPRVGAAKVFFEFLPWTLYGYASVVSLICVAGGFVVIAKGMWDELL